MRRVFTLLLLTSALALTGVTSVASGEPAHKAEPGRRAHADKKWPMSADRFRAEIDGRIGKARDRLERTLERRKVGGAKAQARRQELLVGVAHLRARLAVVSRDGAITRDEAREIRELAKALGRGRR